MRTALFGIGVFIFGLIMVTLFASQINAGNPAFSYYYAIVFSILYLCAITAVSASLILKELRKNR